MYKVFLFSGSPWPRECPRWGVLEREVFRNNNEKNSHRPTSKWYRNLIAQIVRKNKKHNRNNRKKKIDYLKSIYYDYFKFNKQDKNLRTLKTTLMEYIADNEMMDKIEAQAIAGDVKSQITLARCYIIGYKSTPNIAEAIHWARIAAVKSKKAKRLLGFIYLLYVRNYKKAYRCFQELAYEGQVLPQFMVELLDAIMEENTHIIEFVRRKKSVINSEEADDTDKGLAFYMIGLCYYCGLLGKQDWKKAFEHLLKATEYGVVNAYFLVGNFYEHGFTCEQSVDKAIKYYKIAEDYNDQWAVFHLGRLYYRGKLIEKDIEKAKEYFSIGMKQNFLPSKRVLESIEINGV